MRKLVDFRDTVTPEIIKTVLVVRAPGFLASAWNFASKIALTPETAAKVRIASSEKNSLALLREYVPDNLIPAYLGGAPKIDGDAECRRLIAPGGPVPSEVIEELKAMA